MATSTKCIFQNKEISIETALNLRKQNKADRFFCTECGNDVKPHSGGGHTNAHFEHKKRNSKCSLSHNSESYKYIAENEDSDDSLLSEIYNSILTNSSDLINGFKIRAKQLQSATNFVCTPKMDQWTYGKTITIKNKQFKQGGEAKNFLHRNGFRNVLKFENEHLKNEIINKFKTWATRVTTVDLISKIENVQLEKSGIELLVHENVINDLKNKSLKEDNNESETIGREQYYIRKQRTNQGAFRKKMIRIWTECCVTGIKDSNFLIASHIKPWKDCGPKEKISKDNGLLLAAPIDFLFDNYFISFEDNGRAIISNKAKSVLHHFTSINDLKISRKLNMEQKKFMKHHRDLFVQLNTPTNQSSRENKKKIITTSSFF